MEYTLKYRQPYEYDDDDSSGGEHDVGYRDAETTFTAHNDTIASRMVSLYLIEGSVTVGGEVHCRMLLELNSNRKVTL